MNDGIFQKDHDQLVKSYEQMEKAYLFYPSTKCEFLLFVLGTEVLTKMKLSPKEKAILIGKLSRFKMHGITNDMIKGEFINLTQDLLFKQNDKSLYNECHRLLIAKVTDQELRDEINYIFNYEHGRALYNQGNYSKAKPFFEKALLLQPNNVDLGGIFISIIAKSFRTMNTNKVIMDSLHLYQKKYPSLEQYNTFKVLLASALVIQFGEDYDIGKTEAAEKYKLEFENFLKNEPDLEIEPGIIGKAYASACSYYFKKGQKVKAKQYLTDGLKISPNNYELRVRMQMIR
jgi:tetratricopeptide (TPR) repeat protein